MAKHKNGERSFVKKVRDYWKDTWQDFKALPFVTSAVDKLSNVSEKIVSVSGTTAYLAKSAIYQEPYTEICAGLLMGGMPIETKLFNFGDHGKKLIRECEKKQRELGKVYAVVDDFELKRRGLLGLEAAGSYYWSEKGVDYQHILMKANSGKLAKKTQQASAAEISKVINEIHNNYIAKKQSVLVHCNNGQSRSLVFVACYLLKHNPKIKSITDALAFIYLKRPQVGVSMADLDLIEEFRKNFASDKAGLNMKSKKFEPFRTSWTKTFMLDNPLVQFALFEGALRLFGLDQAAPAPSSWNIFAQKSSSLLEGWYSRIAAGTLILMNQGAQKIRARIGEDAYKHLDKQFHTMSNEQKVAVAEGIHSEKGLEEWKDGFKESNTIWHYAAYLAGRRAKQENDPICDKVLKEVKLIRSTPKG